MEPKILLELLAVLRYEYLLLVFLYLVAVLATILYFPTFDLYSYSLRKTISRLFLLVILCFALDIAIDISGAIFWHLWPHKEDIIGLLYCAIVFGIIIQSFQKGSSITIWYQIHNSWALGFFCDSLDSISQFFSTQHTDTDKPGLPPTRRLHIFLACCRCVLFMAIFSVYLWQTGGSNNKKERLLLDPDLSLSLDTTGLNQSPQRQRKSWYIRFRRAKILYPYIQLKEQSMRIRASLVVFCILADNGINFLKPQYYSILIDSFGIPSEKRRGFYVAIFMALTLLSSQAGVRPLRRALWLPVEQYWEKAITMAVFSQIMYLSADFHDSADRGDLYMIMSCIGGIPNIIETICFEVLPTAIDLVVATWYLYAKFGPYEGLIIFSTAAAFITLSLRTVSASHKLSRQLWKR